MYSTERNAAIGSLGAQQDRVPTSPSLKGVSEALDQQLALLQELVKTADQHANKLAGAYGEKAEARAPTPVPNGYVQEIAQKIHALDGMVSDLFNSHQRISQALSD